MRTILLYGKEGASQQAQGEVLFNHVIIKLDSTGKICKSIRRSSYENNGFVCKKTQKINYTKTIHKVYERD